jgi:hypothetical protein
VFGGSAVINSTHGNNCCSCYKEMLKDVVMHEEEFEVGSERMNF